MFLKDPKDSSALFLLPFFHRLLLRMCTAAAAIADAAAVYDVEHSTARVGAIR